MNSELTEILHDDGTGAATANDVLLDGTGATSYSYPVKVGRITGEEKAIRASAPTEITFTIHTVTAALTGNWQGMIGSDENALDNSYAGWSNIDGGDLTSWPSGGSSKITAPYTHIRMMISGGKCKSELASNTKIDEITG